MTRCLSRFPCTLTLSVAIVFLSRADPGGSVCNPSSREDECRAVFEDKTANASSPKLPNLLSPSLAHTLELAFRNYSLVSEGTGVRIMPAGALLRRGTTR